MTKRAAYLIPALAALVLLSACVIKTSQDVQTPVSLTAPGNPSASPSPTTAACDLGGLQPGTAGDTRTIRQGETLAIGVVLMGTQGVPLVSSCLGQYVPHWTGGQPCTLPEGDGYDTAITAPASLAVGTSCTARVTVGSRSAQLGLTVVAP